MPTSVDTSVSAMQQAQADMARLTTVSMVASTAIQGASSTAQAVQGANAAGAEVAKTTGNDIRQAAKSS